MDLTNLTDNNQNVERIPDFVHEWNCDQAGVDMKTMVALWKNPTYFMSCQCFNKWMDSLNPYYQGLIMRELQHEKMYKYFMTWTTKPDSSFEDVVKKFDYFATQSKFSEHIKTLWIADEHLESNPHRHCYIECYKPIMQRNIKSFAKHGHIDRRKAKGTRREAWDYLQKENDPQILIGSSP